MIIGDLSQVLLLFGVDILSGEVIVVDIIRNVSKVIMSRMKCFIIYYFFIFIEIGMCIVVLLFWKS